MRTSTRRQHLSNSIQASPVYSTSVPTLDYALIIGIVISPMTGLRIGQIGPGEVLVLVWSVSAIATKNATKGRKSSNGHLATTIFWIIFLATILTGTIIGISLVPSHVILSHLATWFYFAFISVASVRILLERSLTLIEQILFKIGQWAILWNAFLYFFSLLVQPTFLGSSLWYADSRFSGGGTNPHQVSLVLGSAVIILLWGLHKGAGLSSNWKLGLLALVGVFLCYETGSSTLYMSLIVAIIVLIVVWLLGQMSSSRIRALTLGGLVLIVIAVLPQIGSLLDRFIASDPNGRNRIELWHDLPTIFGLSPLFGLGPGMHSNGGTTEFHNTYIEVLAMSGLIGLSVFLIYHLYIVSRIQSEPMLFAVISVLITYGLAGFAARRLSYWLLLGIILAIGLKSSKSLQARRSSLQIIGR